MKSLFIIPFIYEVIYMKSDFIVYLMIVFVIFIFVSCAGPRMSMTPQQEADMLYEKAIQLSDNESYDEAGISFEEYAKKYPESKRADNAKLQAGNGYFQQGNYDQAIAIYQEILEQYPESDGSDHALLAIGDVYFAQQKFDEAINAYNIIIDKYPRYGVEIAIKARSRIIALQDMQENIKILNEGKDEDKDNAQFDIADIYFTTFADYNKAKEEYKKLVDRFPKSELADDAIWKIAECYWNLASQQIPSLNFSAEHKAFIELNQIYDRFPQLRGIRQFKLEPHWPTNQPSEEYRLSYKIVRQLVNKYPGVQNKSIIDFIPQDYKNAFENWQEILYKYSYTDKAIETPMRIAQAFIDLGNLYYNLGDKRFAGMFFKESLKIVPTPAGHLGMARYYGSIASVSAPAWAYRRAFAHITQAEKMTPPNSPLADKISWTKEWMNYKMRLEALESWQYKKTR
jgi:TolA-binding protein